MNSVLLEMHTSLLMLISKGNDTAPLTSADDRASDLIDKVSWVGNESFDSSYMFNTDLVEREVFRPMERLFEGNKIRGRSTAVQGHADAEAVVAIIRAGQRS